MAKKKAGVNKSVLIREYKEKHPEAGPKEITEALKAHKVSYGLVSNVLHTAKTKKKDAKKKAAKKHTTAHSNGHANGHAADFVKSAFHLGLDQAITLLEKVKKAVS